MGYEGLSGGTPVVMTGTNSNGDMLGGGGFGGFLLGALLSGNGGLFGGNRNGMYGNGYGMGGNGFLGGNIQGEQTAGITGIQGQLNALTSTVNSNQINDQLSNLNNIIINGQADINSNLNAISRDSIASTADVKNAVTNSQFTTLQGLNSLSSTITAQNNQNALQQLNSFNQANTAQLQGFNEIGRDMTTATNQLIDGQNAMSAQMAECCCKLQSTIHSEGETTRALISDIRLSQLNAELTDAKLENSNLMQTNQLNVNNATQTQTILMHLAPLFRPVTTTPAVA
jgi:hypothetical protein